MTLNIKCWILTVGMYILCLLACQQEDLMLIESYQLCSSELIYADTAIAVQGQRTTNFLSTF